jgi:hypothetical protein
MQAVDNINPHYTIHYHNVVDFLENELLNASITGINVMAKKLLLRIKQYLAPQKLDKLILNYHVHTLTYVLVKLG